MTELILKKTPSANIDKKFPAPPGEAKISDSEILHKIYQCLLELISHLKDRTNTPPTYRIFELALIAGQATVCRVDTPSPYWFVYQSSVSVSARFRVMPDAEAVPNSGAIEISEFGYAMIPIKTNRLAVQCVISGTLTVIATSNPMQAIYRNA